MKLNRIIKFLFFLLFFNQVIYAQKDTINPNGYNTFYYPNGFKLSEGYFTQGKPDKYWITYYVNGTKKSEGNRKNYILDSIWIFYDEKGDTTETIYYIRGKKNGFCNKYYTKINGNKNSIKTKELYLNDQKQGYSYYYYPNEVLHRKIKYIDNYKHGEGFEYDTNSTLIAIEQYRHNNLISRQAVNRTNKEGKKTGIWVELFKNGKIKNEITFDNGLPDGTYKEFSPGGKIINIEKYKSGKVIYKTSESKKLDTLSAKQIDIVQDFYPNGKIKSSKTYRDSLPYGTHLFYDKNGKITNAIIYNEFGIKKAEGLVDSGLNKFDEWTFFYETGQIESKGRLNNNSREGKWTFYYPDGSIRQTGYFEDNYPEGTWEWFYNNKSILRRENYLLGELSGIAYELSIDGDTIVKGQYEEGEKQKQWFYNIGDEYATGEYYFGAKTGEWKIFYFPEMTIKRKTNYVDGEKNGKQTEYYKNKRIKETGYYSANKKTGKWVYYNNTGTLNYTAEYYRGEIIKVNNISLK